MFEQICIRFSRDHRRLEAKKRQRNHQAVMSNVISLPWLASMKLCSNNYAWSSRPQSLKLQNKILQTVARPSTDTMYLAKVLLTITACVVHLIERGMSIMMFSILRLACAFINNVATNYGLQFCKPSINLEAVSQWLIKNHDIAANQKFSRLHPVFICRSPFCIWCHCHVGYFHSGLLCQKEGCKSTDGRESVGWIRWLCFPKIAFSRVFERQGQQAASLVLHMKHQVQKFSNETCQHEWSVKCLSILHGYNKLKPCWGHKMRFLLLTFQSTSAASGNGAQAF